MLRKAVIRALAVLTLCGYTIPAQEADSASRAPQDSVLERALQLVKSGREIDGRRLLDSILASTTPDSARYAEVLYWRGVYAPTAADAERDYRRLLIEAPLAPRAEDALLQLAQLEQARGDRRGASDHLQRFLLSYPNSPSRQRASVQLVRLLFDQGPQQLARACEALRTARSEVPPANVELRNQLEANAPRCAFVEAQPAPTPAVDATPTAPARTQRASPPATGTTPSAPSAYYSVQVAAFDAPEAASHMAKQLADRRIDARVDGTSPPFRVRVGKYTTRADAVKAAADLKAMGHNGFITLVNPGARP
jgi:cell division protein FtsN